MRLTFLKRFALDLWRDERGEVGVEEPETATDAPADDPPADEPSDKPITKADLDKLESEWKRKHEEALELAEHWYEQANQPKPAETTDDDSDDDDALAIVDDINKRGKKALDDYLKGKGFITPEEADKLIQQKAEALQVQSKLVDEYPELTDKTSDLFKETARQMKALEGTGMRQDKRLAQAVFNAELKLIKDGKRSPADSEQERLKAVGAQNGAKGKKGSESKPSATLSATQIAWAKQIYGDKWKEQSADIAKRSQRLREGGRTEE